MIYVEIVANSTYLHRVPVGMIPFFVPDKIGSCLRRESMLRVPVLPIKGPWYRACYRLVFSPSMVLNIRLPGTSGSRIEMVMHQFTLDIFVRNALDTYGPVR